MDPMAITAIISACTGSFGAVVGVMVGNRRARTDEVKMIVEAWRTIMEPAIANLERTNNAYESLYEAHEELKIDHQSLIEHSRMIEQELSATAHGLWISLEQLKRNEILPIWNAQHNLPSADADGE